MIKNHVDSLSNVTEQHQSHTVVTKEEEKKHEVAPYSQNETETSVEKSCILEVHGGSISDRLAALQRSGSENWKKRLGGRPKIELKPKVELENKPLTPIMRVKDKPPSERPHSLLERIMKLGEAQDQWRNRVEEKDANQFTVAGKMGQMQYSPYESPVLSRKRFTPKAVKIRSKTTNIEQLSSYSTENLCFLPCSPSPLSKSQPSLAASSSSLDLDKSESKQRISHVVVPRVDDEYFTSFFRSFRSVKDRIIEDSRKIHDEIFEIITSEAHELLTHKKGVQVKRKHASSGNPLKILASRSDLKMDYEEVYRGVAERELERMKIEQLAKSSTFALSALAGLASTEDFKSVALKKANSTDSLSENTCSLIQIKGRRYAQVRLVEPVGSSMNHGDCYVLVTLHQIYCWLGEFSNVIERVKASEVANLIQSSKELGFKSQKEVIFIEEDKESYAENQKAFFAVLSMKPEDVRVSGSPDEDELYEKAIVDTNAAYEVEKEELLPYEEYCGAVLKIEMLKPDKVFVFDFGAEMYVWCGKLTSPELRKSAVVLGKDLWNQGYNYSECDLNPLNATFGGPEKKSRKRPSWAVFGKTSQHMETVLFKEKFFDWPNMHPLIRQKRQSSGDKSGSISDLRPCEVKEMLENDVEEPDMVLENSHIGRGVEYHDELERRHFRISTISCKVWHISEYSYKNLPIESWGQFHSEDTYVIRWHYMISNIGRTLHGNASRHSFVGRKRWAYFFWQGENSSITEKGACALMTVELDEEKGPHVRVTNNKEPPCFLNLFAGQMIVYKGKRDDSATNDVWKLFMLQGDMKSEVVLIQIGCSVRNLRSRTSFVLLNISSGAIYIWYGCKSASHSRSFILEAVNSFNTRKPKEMGFHKDVNSILSEVEEGSEPDGFWEGLGNDDRSLYCCLLNSEFQFDFTPRLFLITSSADCQTAKEIFCPFFTKQHCCPFPFLQTDLKHASHPALFLLDNKHEIFLWQGWLLTEDKDSENLVTGSAELRWDVNRKLAMETALRYCQDKKPEDPPKAYAVSAGSEPLSFTNIFPEWKPWKELGVSQNMEPCKVAFVQEVLSQLSRDRYSLDELQRESRPPGVDPLRLESYLTDSEFQEVLGVNKEEFYSLPSWKQCKMKKEKGLF